MNRVVFYAILPLSVIMFVFIMSGCSDDFSTDPPETDDSYFEAFVTGEINREYFGTAIFGYFTDPEAEADGIHIELVSHNPFEIQGFGFTGKIDGDPELIRYDIVEFPYLLNNDTNPFIDLETETFFGLFAPGADGMHSDLFASSEGYIDFLELTEDRLTGEFSFTAFGYKIEDHTDTVWVEIEGEFEAIIVQLQ